MERWIRSGSQWDAMVPNQGLGASTRRTMQEKQEEVIQNRKALDVEWRKLASRAPNHSQHPKLFQSMPKYAQNVDFSTGLTEHIFTQHIFYTQLETTLGKGRHLSACNPLSPQAPTWKMLNMMIFNILQSSPLHANSGCPLAAWNTRVKPEIDRPYGCLITHTSMGPIQKKFKESRDTEMSTLLKNPGHPDSKNISVNIGLWWILVRRQSWAWCAECCWSFSWRLVFPWNAEVIWTTWKTRISSIVCFQTTYSVLSSM